MRIAYFGPLPPSPGEVAEHGERLTRELARHADVGVLVDGDRPSGSEIAAHCRIHDLAELHYRHVLHAYDVVVYAVAIGQIGDSMRAALADWPGIVAIHESDIDGLFTREPTLRRPILEQALALIVHSPALAERLATECPWTPAFLLARSSDRLEEEARRYLAIGEEVVARGEGWLQLLLETACAEVPGFVPGDRQAPWRAEVEELTGLRARKI